MTPDELYGPMDPDDSDPVPPLHRNLDAAHRSLAEAEGVLRSVLAGEDPDLTNLRAIAGASPQLRYEELTESNDELRESLGWGTADLDALLTEKQRKELNDWRAAKRLDWGRDDLVAVGLAGAIGILATVIDTQVDAGVRDGLQQLRETDLLQGWETDAKGMPIDYTGPNFGGPDHRVRSSGHDLGRILSALRQIRDGQFRGVVWSDGERTTFTTSPGQYTPVDALGEALILWGKHLAADFLTPMSLPMPGWTWLYELPDREVRKFAHTAYRGSVLGQGVNARSGLVTPMLSYLSTETIIRTHVHARAYRATGSWSLTPAEVALQNELLLAGHAIVGAACLGHAFSSLILGEGSFAIRHLNVPVLIRIAALALKVQMDAKERSSLKPPTWDELLLEASSPWLLDDAVALDSLAVSV